MSSIATIHRLSPAFSRARAATERLAALPVLYVLLPAVGVYWIAVLATALVVRHAGWIYYQGGDQLWYYTLAELLGHGQLTQTLVGYLWSAMLAPLSWFAGANVVSAYPVITLANVLVLTPVAMLALYGVASRIGGRLFAYWTLAFWLCVPFVGILYVNHGYHQRYTELLLPQALGLTGMADFPSMVFCLVAIYFCTRALLDARPQLVHAVAGGVAAGAAIGIKPSTTLFLAGPALAFLWTRRIAHLGAFGAAILPAALVLALWKSRGLGNLPLLNGAEHGTTLAAAAPLAGLNFHRYLNFDWAHFTNNIDLLREHFWSGRLIVWLLLAGTFGLARRSTPAALLVGGWFFAFAFVKGGYTAAGVEDGSVFRIMMPAYPAFLLLLASVPLLVPRLAARLRSWEPGFPTLGSRTRWGLIGVALLLTAVVPFAAIAAASPSDGGDVVDLNATPMPIPVVDLALRGTQAGRQINLTWKADHSFGGPVFYRVWRSRTDGLTCPAATGVPLCNVTMPEIGLTREGAFVDHPARGRWVYRVAVAANWLKDPQYGDPYVISRPLTLVVR